jgi:hypothetical protein
MVISIEIYKGYEDHANSTPIYNQLVAMSFRFITWSFELQESFLQTIL